MWLVILWFLLYLTVEFAVWLTSFRQTSRPSKLSSKKLSQAAGALVQGASPGPPAPLAKTSLVEGKFCLKLIKRWIQQPMGEESIEWPTTFSLIIKYLLRLFHLSLSDIGHQRYDTKYGTKIWQIWICVWHQIYKLNVKHLYDLVSMVFASAS